jgi:RNA polymerase sigma-70 factor, ECF subfamily
LRRRRTSEEAGPAQFGLLLQQHDDRMRALAYGMLGNRTAMDDALQDAYLKAWRARATFRADSSFATWLHRIVANTCIDHLRRRRPTVPLEVVEPVDDDPGAEQRIGAVDELQAALDLLHPDQRLAVLLVDGEGLSYDEAAEVMGVAHGTVASRLNRGRAAVRRTLVDERGEER